MIVMAMDPPVSEKQRRAMYAARAGKSTLGIPKKVGEEYVGKDGKPIAAGIVFVAPDGEVLVLRRSSTEKNYAGHWSLPGGKADDGETAKDAACREAIEELGMDPGDGALKLLDCIETPNGMLFSTFVRPTEKKFVPMLNDEHSGYAWTSLDSLPTPLHPGVKRVLGEHIGVTEDMKPEDWDNLREGFARWTREEQKEPEHQAADMAMDKFTVRTYDVDGRMHVAMTNISKSNVCPYFGREIPDYESLGLNPDTRYQLLRDPDELRKAAPSFNNIQLLIKHVPVSADDHQADLIVGSTGTDAKFEPPYLTNSLVIWAKEGIDAVEDESQKELSSGYRYRADMTPGTFEGVAYDGVMRDIIGNHIALVSAGRAGADVVVGDEKIKDGKEVSMSKIVLTRKAALAGGAIVAYLLPRMAQDSKFDATALLKDVTSKNFASKKAGIIAGITKDVKLAKDAELDHLPELLDKLEKCNVEEGIDEDPNSGLPMTKEAKDEMEAKAKDAAEEEEKKKKEAEDKSAMDRKARDEKGSNFLKEKLSAEDKAAYDAMMGEAEDEDGEEDKDKDKAKDGVTKAAMDAALKGQRDEILKQSRDAAEAREFVQPWVGKLSLALDSADAIYETALKAVKVDVKGIHPSAYRALLTAQPKPGEQRHSTVALDSAIGDTTGFNSRFPDAGRIANIG